MHDSALWTIAAAGFLLGWWWRGRHEARAHRDDLPQWMARIGQGLLHQFHAIDRNHRFAGDDLDVTSEQTYEGGGKSFVVVARRKRPVVIDQ